MEGIAHNIHSKEWLSSIYKDDCFMRDETNFNLTDKIIDIDELTRTVIITTSFTMIYLFLNTKIRSTTFFQWLVSIHSLFVFSVHYSQLLSISLHFSFLPPAPVWVQIGDIFFPRISVVFSLKILRFFFWLFLGLIQLVFLFLDKFANKNHHFFKYFLSLYVTVTGSVVIWRHPFSAILCPVLCWRAVGHVLVPLVVLPVPPVVVPVPLRGLISGA